MVKSWRRAKAVYEIAYISRHGRAPKVGPPLFALAMAATYGHLGTRELAFGYLSQMARTGQPAPDVH